MLKLLLKWNDKKMKAILGILIGVVNCIGVELEKLVENLRSKK